MSIRVKLVRDDVPAGVWVGYREGARIKVRALSKSRARELRAQATVAENEWRRGRIVERETVDEGRYDRLLADHLIEDWEGFVDPDGNEIPCNPENKFLMMDQCLEFASFVTDAAMNIQSHLADREAKLTRNLSDTSAGSAESRRNVPPAARQGESIL